MFRISFCLGILVVLLAALPARGDQLTLVTLESPPAEFRANGTPSGRNVDIVVEGLQRMGHTAQILFRPWRRAIRLGHPGHGPWAAAMLRGCDLKTISPRATVAPEPVGAAARRIPWAGPRRGPGPACWSGCS